MEFNPSIYTGVLQLMLTVCIAYGSDVIDSGMLYNR